MTSPESYRSFSVIAALDAAHIPMGPIEPSRRLVRSDIPDQVVEFYSATEGGRVLAVPQARDGVLYQLLAEHGQPVFDAIDRSPHDLLFLRVPPGTYSLRSRLHLIRRNLHDYGSVLTDIVASQQRQYEAGLGIMASGDTSIIDRFALLEDRGAETGLTPILLPPFGLDAGNTPEAFANAFAQELVESGGFNERQYEHLNALIWRGFSGGS